MKVSILILSDLWKRGFLVYFWGDRNCTARIQVQVRSPLCPLINEENNIKAKKPRNACTTTLSYKQILKKKGPYLDHMSYQYWEVTYYSLSLSLRSITQWWTNLIWLPNITLHLTAWHTITHLAGDGTVLEVHLSTLKVITEQHLSCWTEGRCLV